VQNNGDGDYKVTESLRLFDKYCIYVKNSVYLKGLIDLLYESCPSSHIPRMKWRSGHEGMLSEMVLLALFCVLPLSLYASISSIQQQRSIDLFHELRHKEKANAGKGGTA